MRELLSTALAEGALARRGLLAAYLLVAFILLARAGEGRRGGPFAIAFVLASLVFVLACRWPLLHFAGTLDSDEELMGANAMVSRFGWLNWDIVDPTTSGPLNSMLLAWQYLIGRDIAVFYIRLTAVGCIVGFAGFLFGAITRFANLRVAIVAVLPVILFAGLTQHPDFVHYSSEHLPLVLIGAAMFLVSLTLRHSERPPLLAAAVLLGCVPFAKLQAAPLAAMIGGAVLARAWHITRAGERVPWLIAIVLAALLPGVVFLLPLALSGGLEDFANSYLLQQSHRAIGWLNPTLALLDLSAGFRILMALYLTVIGLALLWRWHARGEEEGPPSRSISLWVALFAIVSYLAVIVPGRAYPHYLLLLLPALVLTAAWLLSEPVVVVRQPRRMPLWPASLFLVAVGGAVLESTARGEIPEHATRNPHLQGSAATTSPHSLAWLRAQPSDRIVCWGWKPRCYLDTGLPGATRDMTNENQLYDTPLRSYFRARFIADFDRTRPDFIIDQVAPANFYFVDPARHGVATFPELWDRLSRDFVRVSKGDAASECPRLYVRRGRWAQLRESLIDFDQITASAEEPGRPAGALDDRSIEEVCNDYWLLPPGVLGTATLRFKDASATRTVALLNTRRGSGDFSAGTGDVRLVLMREDVVVATQELRLRRYPHWTFATLPEGVIADRLVIEILSLAGTSGGLNEVKAYRD